MNKCNVDFTVPFFILQNVFSEVECGTLDFDHINEVPGEQSVKWDDLEILESDHIKEIRVESHHLNEVPGEQSVM